MKKSTLSIEHSYLLDYMRVMSNKIKKKYDNLTELVGNEFLQITKETLSEHFGGYIMTRSIKPRL